MKTNTVELLRELCDSIGVSGYEDEVRELIRRRIEPWVSEMNVDPLGNLIAWRRAASKDAPTLMLDAHMDEIGLVISYIEPNGFLRFATIGGWDARVLPAHAVTIVTRSGDRLRGVIGVAPPHIQRDEEKQKPYSVESLFIDVGARSREEAEDVGIAVGDQAVPFYPFTMMGESLVMAKALDDRAGCAVLIRILEHLAQLDALPVNIAALFSTFEETGARGAAVGSYTVRPHIALAFEGTTAGDFPGVPLARCPAAQGNGTAITLMDRTTHCSPRVVRKLEELATAHGIPFQLKKPIFGGTDAARIHISRGGVLTGVLSVPCRYIHSPHATMRLEDFDATVNLAVAFIQECHVLLES